MLTPRLLSYPINLVTHVFQEGLLSCLFVQNDNYKSNPCRDETSDFAIIHMDAKQVH